jgi:hypothetical protein
MMFILREKTKEYKRNMMKIFLDIFLTHIILMAEVPTYVVLSVMEIYS